MILYESNITNNVLNQILNQNYYSKDSNLNNINVKNVCGKIKLTNIQLNIHQTITIRNIISISCIKNK